jgi:hypothetical protein
MMGRRRSGRKVHDDRGREVEPLRPSSAADLPKDSPQAQLVRRLACNDFTIAGPQAVGAAILFFIGYVVAMGVVNWLSLPDWVGSTIGYALFAAGGIMANWLFWTGSAKQIAMTAVRRGLCGSCGYSLEALAPEPDGCLLCPECGAAWRQGRVTRPHWKVPFIEREEKRAWWRFPPVHRLAADDRGGFADVLDLGLTRVVGITLDEREAIRRD